MRRLDRMFHDQELGHRPATGIQHEVRIARGQWKIQQAEKL